MPREASRRARGRCLAGLKPLRPRLAPLAPDVAADHLGLDAGGRRAGLKTERKAERGDVGLRVVVGAEGFGAAERLLKQLIELESARLARDEVERRRAVARGAEIRERRIARFEQHELRFPLVDHLEMGGDIGLERKEPQQPLGKGVQRLNLEAARRLDRTREQLPRETELLRTRPRSAAVDDFLRQCVVAEARPLGERVEDAVGHVGGRRLGEGEA